MARKEASAVELARLNRLRENNESLPEFVTQIQQECTDRLSAVENGIAEKGSYYSQNDPLPRIAPPPFARDIRSKYCDEDRETEAACSNSDEGSIQALAPNTKALVAGAGVDVLYIQQREQGSMVAAGPGEDIIEGGEQRDMLWGEEDDDLIYGHEGPDFLDGGGGSDLLRAGAGDDEIIGGDGNDRLFGGLGRDVIIAGPGDDTIFTGDGEFRDEQWNVVFPGPGRDVVYGAEGPDHVIIPHKCEIIPGKVLYGGEGEDVLRLPVSLREAESLGLEVHGFERIIVDDSEPYLSPCSGYTPTPECTDIPAWQNGRYYEEGDTVRVDDQRYRRTRAGRSRPSTFPRNGPDVQGNEEMWEALGRCLAPLRGSCQTTPPRWNGARSYSDNEVVLGRDGNIYSCKPSPYGSHYCSTEDPTSPQGKPHWILERLCLEGRTVVPPAEISTDDEVPEIFDQRLRKWDERYGSDVVEAVYGYRPETSRAFVQSGLAYYIDENQEVQKTRFERRHDGSTEIRVQGERVTLTASEAEGALYSTPELAEEMIGGYSNLTKSVINKPSKAWKSKPKIYYYNGLDAKFGKYELPWIFSYWAKVTPFKFKEAKSLKSCRAKKQCIYFKEVEGTCSSRVGKTLENGSHVVNVSPEAYCRGKDRWLLGWKHGACLHEVGHVLGLSHMHQRPDARAQGLVFIEENIADEENKSQVLPDENDQSSAYGPFDLGSVMMYSRTAFGNGKITIQGAPKDKNRVRLAFTDAAGVLAANYRHWLYVGKGRDFTGKRRRFRASAKNMWSWKVDENFGSMDIEDMRSLTVPAGVRIRLFDYKEGHGGQFDSLRYGAYSRIVPITLEGDVSRIQMRPAVDLFDEPGYNGPHESLDAGRFDQFESVFKTLGSAVVGHGLRARVCGPRFSSGKWKCETLSTGSHWKLDKNYRPERADIQIGATLYRSSAQKHLGASPKKAETLVPYSDGKPKRWYRKDLENSSVMKKASYIFVHPGISTIACGNDKCIIYNAGLHKIDSVIRPLDELVVESAVTFFDEDNFDIDSDHQTFIPGEYTSKYDFLDVNDNDLESLIVGPGLEVTACDKKSGKGPCETFQASNDKPRFIMSLQDNLKNDVSYIKVTR